jgi:hypothetical protein
MEVLVMENNQKRIKLTSAELSYLWNTYLADGMSVCVFKYFLQHIEDVEIKTLVSHALDLSQQHLEIIRGIFTDEDIKVPEGFTEKDVRLNAKRLFSDVSSVVLNNQLIVSASRLEVYPWHR